MALDGRVALSGAHSNRAAAKRQATHDQSLERLRPNEAIRAKFLSSACWW